MEHRTAHLGRGEGRAVRGSSRILPGSTLQTKGAGGEPTRNGRSAASSAGRNESWAPGGTAASGAENQAKGSCAGKTIPESSQGVTLSV